MVLCEFFFAYWSKCTKKRPVFNSLNNINTYQYSIRILSITLLFKYSTNANWFMYIILYYTLHAYYAYWILLLYFMMLKLYYVGRYRIEFPKILRTVMQTTIFIWISTPTIIMWIRRDQAGNIISGRYSKI